MAETTPRGAVRMFAVDVARAAGVAPGSISRYHSLAQKSRERAARIAAGQPRPADLEGARLPQERDMPPPDGHDYPPDRKVKAGARGPSGSKSPWWWPETITPWLATRQGPGNPRGGPPRRRKAHARPGPRRRRPAGDSDAAAA